MNNQYGYIGKVQYCDCGGILIFYEGVLGYESLVCNKCGKVEELENISEKFVNEISDKTKFQIHDHNLEFFGLCVGCQKELL